MENFGKPEKSRKIQKRSQHSYANNIRTFYEKINQNKVMSKSTQYSKRKIFVLVPKKLVSWIIPIINTLQFSFKSRFSIFVSLKNLHLRSRTFKAQISATFHYYRDQEKVKRIWQKMKICLSKAEVLRKIHKNFHSLQRKIVLL